MTAVADFLKRAADRNGFRRDRFVEDNIPTDFSNVCIVPVFSDIRSMVVLSSFLLNRYRVENKGSKYFVVASWPGYQGLFPYADEYWSMTDEAVLKRFYEGSEGLRNRSDLAVVYARNLHEFFRDVVDINDIGKLYRYGLTNHFFDKYKDTRRFLPFVPSASILGRDFNRELATRSGYKVFLHPSLYVKFWHHGMSENVRANRDFYIQLIDAMVERNITPVVWQNFNSYEVAGDVGDKAIYFREPDVIKALAAMRSTGCVLDVFNGLSRYAMLARVPFLCMDERTRYNATKENELDGLLGSQIPKQYIFSFSTLLTTGTPLHWATDAFPSICNRLDKFLPELNRDEWPSTAESNEIVSYDKLVRVHKPKKLGTRFIRVVQD